MMKIIAVDSRSDIGSWLIKIFTFSKWNHVAALFDDTVFDASAKHGVRLMSLSSFKHLYPRHEVIDVALPNEFDALSFAYAQVGKKYDWTAIFGILFQKRSWEKPDKWFCSELVEAICVAGGKRRFRSEVSRILPRETYGRFE